MKKCKNLPEGNIEILIPHERILERVAQVASSINSDYADVERPLFLAVLNGSYAFMGDLMKEIDFECEISFVKYASYVDNVSSGKMRSLIGLNESIEGRDVILVEDIVDSGATICALVKDIEQMGAKSVKICTLLLKPEAYKGDCEIDYYAMTIGNEYIFGYGLDYNYLYRNLKDIYVIKES